MDAIKYKLIKKALASPSQRQNIINKGTMFLYCDYAGFVSHNDYGAACCAVYSRTVSITAKKLPIDRDQGSNYGEMQAIVLSLETLSAALLELRPKIAVIFTDCSRILRIIAQDRFAHPHDEQGRNELLAALANLNGLFPEVDVQIKYISKHKKNNYFHRLAHNAAREAAVLPSILASTIMKIGSMHLDL
ncbi:RNase H family protein [Paenibacillus sp. YIM B09110]|uniref:RNase H family protein n=1 Tax=Paenibacillus sp. YIM B09110 TaxID=3126102 RepID=UPI00301C7EC9